VLQPPPLQPHEATGAATSKTELKITLNSRPPLSSDASTPKSSVGVPRRREGLGKAPVKAGGE